MRCTLRCAVIVLLSACAAAPPADPVSSSAAAAVEATRGPRPALPFHVAVARPKDVAPGSRADDAAGEREVDPLVEALASELDGRVFALATIGRDGRADYFLEWTIPSDGGVELGLFENPGESVPIPAPAALLEVSMEAPVDVRFLAERLAGLAPEVLFPADEVLRLDWEALSIEPEPGTAPADGGASAPGANAPARYVTVEGAVEIPEPARISRLRAVHVVADVELDRAGSKALVPVPMPVAAVVGAAELLPNGDRRFAFRAERVPALTPFLRLELVAGSREFVRRRFTLRVPRAAP